MSTATTTWYQAEISDNNPSFEASVKLETLPVSSCKIKSSLKKICIAIHSQTVLTDKN